MKYLFIVGCPRSGTTWASWLLAQHPATVIALHTGFFQALAGNLAWVERPSDFGNRVVGSPPAEAESNGDGLPTLSTVVPPAELYGACRPLAQCLLNSVARSNPEAEWVVEKTPENLLEADFIRAVLPEARFLHVVRDPRAVFSSMRAAAARWAFPGDLPTHPGAFGRGYWNRYVAMHERLQGDVEHYRVVRYEDLLADGPAELEAIFAWLNLETDGAFCERAVEASSIDRMRDRLAAPQGFFRTGKADTWKRDLPSWQLRSVEHLCTAGMRRFGYDQSSSNATRAPLRLRLSDRSAAAGRRLMNGPSSKPISWVLGRARRSSETFRRMKEET